MISSKKAIAVLGGGRMGSLRANLISKHPSLRLAMILDNNTSIQEVIKSRFSADVIVGSNELFMERSEELGIEGVWISTPTSTHYNAITSACKMEHVKSIYCEKPVAFTSREVRIISVFCS
jgi:predicted dehydrogenase